MDIIPFVPADRQIIQSYGDGGFRISGVRHEGSVLLFPLRVVSWSITAAADITPESLQQIAEERPAVELLLVGTGPRMTALDPALRRHFRALSMAIEVMDTGAACRTYNVLLAEERRVAAALIAVG